MVQRVLSPNWLDNGDWWRISTNSALKPINHEKLTQTVGLSNEYQQYCFFLCQHKRQKDRWFCVFYSYICICLCLLSLTPVPVSCRWDVTSLWPRGSSHPLCLCSDSSICCNCLCLFISALPFSYTTTLFRAQDVDTRPRDSCIRYSHPALVAASQNEKMDF